MNRILASRVITLLGYFGLMAILLAWNAWLAPSQYFPIALALIVLVVPLLFPLRGLLHGKPYTYAWSSFLSPFYFAYGFNEAWINPAERYLAVAVVITSLMMFTGSMFYIHYHHKATTDIP
ncbi:MAG TPA: DUF2069 domain-containing protein [Chromatiaceae bacterium]|jgi:uncharacterized membrane protein|nr:DUF2069 domain-containing protein [Chromatiaceae bacterium]HIN82991.1 DUF2069 domain-containing protein [Chromatiales bacterium]HIA07893.1 DUF2069 domain-containing protein [Chromatiaceae bacterium]HIB84965.1 DUF2069 domain-containing protein [Chromatiaceae bacterium]HIO14772.1 DUF2069 domain-containing protein [Chromatiales bacterium]